MWLSRKEASCLQVGDIIKTPVKIPGTTFDIPLFTHCGIILEVCKVLYICHIPGNVEPVLESVESFEGKRRIVRIFRNEQTEKLTSEELINNYHLIAKKKYSFLRYNCEDFIRDITKHEINIGVDQIIFYCRIFFVLLFILIIIYLIRNDKG